MNFFNNISTYYELRMSKQLYLCIAMALNFTIGDQITADTNT